MISVDLRDLAAILGVVLFCAGAYFIYQPLALVALGLLFIIGAFIYEPSGRVKDGTNQQHKAALDRAGGGASATGPAE